MSYLFYTKANFLIDEIKKDELLFNNSYISDDFYNIYEKASSGKYSILFFHLDMEDNFLENFETIKKEYPSINILAIRNAPNNIEGCELLKKGFKAYMHSISNIHIINSAIETVKMGNSWIYPELMNYLINIVPSHSTKDEEALSNLTPKEMEILELVSKGNTNAKIAEILNIAEITVKKHISSLFKKFGVKDRLSLALIIKK